MNPAIAVGRNEVPFGRDTRNIVLDGDRGIFEGLKQHPIHVISQALICVCFPSVDLYCAASWRIKEYNVLNNNNIRRIKTCTVFA